MIGADKRKRTGSHDQVRVNTGSETSTVYSRRKRPLLLLSALLDSDAYKSPNRCRRHVENVPPLHGNNRSGRSGRRPKKSRGYCPLAEKSPHRRHGPRDGSRPGTPRPPPPKVESLVGRRRLGW